MSLILFVFAISRVTATVLDLNEGEWLWPQVDVDGKIGKGRCTGAKYFYAPVSVRLWCPSGDKYGCLKKVGPGDSTTGVKTSTGATKYILEECSNENTDLLCKDGTTEEFYACDPTVHVQTAKEKDCLEHGAPFPWFMTSPRGGKNSRSWLRSRKVFDSTAFYFRAESAEEGFQQWFWYVDDTGVGEDKCATLFAYVTDSDQALTEEVVHIKHALRASSDNMTSGDTETDIPIPSDKNPNKVKVGKPFIETFFYPARVKCKSANSDREIVVDIKVDYIFLFTSVTWERNDCSPKWQGNVTNAISIDPNVKKADIKKMLLEFYNKNVQVKNANTNTMGVGMGIEGVQLGKHRPMYYRQSGETWCDYYERYCSEYFDDRRACKPGAATGDRNIFLYCGFKCRRPNGKKVSCHLFAGSNRTYCSYI